MTRGRIASAWAIAGALTVIGLVVFIAGLMTPVTFGWFAYQPLANATFAPGGAGVFLSPTTVIGLGVLILGLVTLAFLTGWLAGANRRS